jgi:PAS domain S-box-containing protein
MTQPQLTGEDAETRSVTWDEWLYRVLVPRVSSIPVVWRYVVAVLLVSAAALMRQALMPWMGTGSLSNLTLAAVIFATVWLGIGPGLLAVVIGNLEVEFFVASPRGPLLGRLVPNLVLGVLICALLHALRAAQAKAGRREREAVAEAAGRRRAAEALAASEGRLRELFDSMLEAYCVIEMIFDERGVPVDFRYLETNPAFVRHATQPMLGRRIKEIVPNLEQFWLDKYGQVALTGQPVELEHVVAGLGDQWFHTSAFPIGGAGSRRVGVVFENITRRKRAEEVSREGAHRFQILAQTMLQGVVHQNREGTIISMNPAAERILGKTRQEFLGSSSISEEHDTIHEDGSPFAGLQHPAMVALRTGQTVRSVTMGVFNPQEGAYRWISVDAVPLFRPGEETPYEVYTVFDDITERRRAHQELERVSRLLAEGQNLAHLGSFEYVAATGTTVWSEEEYRIYGLDPAEPSPAWDVMLERCIHPDDADLVHKSLMAAVQNGSTYELEHRIVRPDGSVRWVFDRAYPHLDEAGKLIRYVGATLDISDRKQAEEALRRQQAEIQALLENTPAGLVLFDASPPYRVLAHNRYYQELFAEPFRSKGMAGLNVDEYAPAVQAEGVIAVLDEVVRTRQPKRFLDFPYKSNPPAQSWFNWYISPLILEGNVVALVNMTLDVTERHLAEAALHEANTRLEEADRQKNAFIAMMSHELRNPLAPIRYALPLVKAEPLGGPASRALNVIARQVDQLTRLVDDLLDVSRITSDKIELRRTQVTLASLVTAAAEAVSSAVIAAHHTLKTIVPDEPVLLHADPARLTQVITNLLDNSTKYTRSGGEITLAAGYEDGSAVIRVRDTGIGLSADALPHVFEMFWQASGPDRSQAGLGIGLSLARRLVEMHGGTIEARSAGLGQGSEFVIRLPAVRETTGADISQPATVAGGVRLRVLIVDDNADLVEMLALSIEAAGHQVRKALDGPGALLAAMEYHPDVVLLDLGLPRMSGIEVAGELRRRPETADTTLVALTGWGQEEHQRATQAAGFDYHLTKPTDPQELHRLLADIAARISA